MDPPMWGSSTLNQYRLAFLRLLAGAMKILSNKPAYKERFCLEICNYNNNIFVIFHSGTMLPQYIINHIQENQRKYAGTSKVGIICLNEFHLQHGASVNTYFQQRESAIFTSRMHDTYDAYEKDIAMVSFFFKKNTLFEFKR